MRIAMFGVVGIAGGALVGALAGVVGWLAKGAATTPAFQAGLERTQGACAGLGNELNRAAQPLTDFLGKIAGSALNGFAGLLDGGRDALRGFNDASGTAAARASAAEENIDALASAANHLKDRLSGARDAGEGRFDDVALYLDEKLSRKAAASAAVARSPEEVLIIDQANTIANPHAPTRQQIELLWCVICQALDALIARDVAPKRARKSVVALLLCISIRLAKNEAALRDLVKAKHARWILGGRCLDAIQDNRAEKSGFHRAAKLTPAVRAKLVGHALINCGGRESQAWRELQAAGELPAELMAAHTSTPSRKSYMPASIRRAITPEVNRLKPIHHGPREAQLRGAFHTRNYEGVAAGEWFQADDVTPPVYFYTQSDAGELSLIRGQWLPMIDVRSAKVLGFTLKAVEEMIELWPERFRTEIMQGFSGSQARKYSREQVKEIFEGISARPCTCERLDHGSAAFRYRLMFDSRAEEYVCWLVSSSEGRLVATYDPENFANEERDERERLIASGVGVSIFEKLCQDAARDLVDGTCGLADFLFKRICLDPSLGPSEWGPWYLPKLRQTLIDYHSLCVDRAVGGLALTKITEKVFEALDYSLEVRGLVLIQGLERRGKTFSAKAWCDLHPGEARYVKTPSTSDDIGFFREIARSLGIGCGQSIKTVELRDRIEETLLGGDLMLVFDNAHYLFRQAMYREAIPQRLTWILTALVDEGLPVAFISTPQFTVAQQLTAEKSKWREAQLTGRIEHFEALPEELSAEDLAAVARAWLPEATPASVEFLVTYAQASDKYLQAIGSLAQRAIYLAKKQGRNQPALNDIKEALKAGVIPSDNAIVAATESAKDHVHRRGSRRSTSSRVRASRIRTEKAEIHRPETAGIEGRSESIPAAESSLIPDRNFSRVRSPKPEIESPALT